MTKHKDQTSLDTDTAKWKSLNRLKKAELIQAINLLEKENHKLVDDYNTVIYLAENENKIMFNTISQFATEIAKASKFKHGKDSINIPTLIKHVKKSCKRW